MKYWGYITVLVIVLGCKAGYSLPNKLSPSPCNFDTHLHKALEYQMNNNERNRFFLMNHLINCFADSIYLVELAERNIQKERYWVYESGMYLPEIIGMGDRQASVEKKFGVVFIQTGCTPRGNSWIYNDVMKKRVLADKNLNVDTAISYTHYLTNHL
jgi:hypothetical protein